MSTEEKAPPSWEEIIWGDDPEVDTKLTAGPPRTEEKRPPPSAPPTTGALPFKPSTFAWINRRYYIVFLAPLLLCPIPIVINDPIGYTAYIILIMAIFWCTEAISLAVTALLPLVLFPAFGVMPAAQVSVQYFKDITVLFFGGLMVAVAIENCNLHKRIALGMLLLVGSKPRWMMLGFMTITAFLSMWISNTATTAMMLPIAQAVLAQLKSDNINKNQDAADATGKVTKTTSDRFNGRKEEFHVVETDNQPEDSPKKSLLNKVHQDERYQLMCKGIVLCVPYAANIGGTATLTGTGPNLVLAGQVESLYGEEISFGDWMLYALPGMLICVVLTWIWLQILYVDLWGRKKMGGELDHKGAAKVIRKAYNELGPITFAEKAVLGHFILLIVLWVTRNPGFISGWSVLFPEGNVTDGTVAMFVAILLFLFPSRMPTFLWGRPSAEDRLEKNGPIPALLEWPIIHEKMSWLVVFLLGGGFALAEACKVSGLSDWIADQFVFLAGLPPFAIAIVISIIVAGFTEVTSNTATATIFLPILGSLAEGLGINPLFLMLPATVACSFAFMLPVATPPNAIAFAYKQVTVMDMVKTGFVLNVICVLVANASLNTLGFWVFDVGTFPDWANETLGPDG